MYLGVPTGLGGPGGRVALDDEQLGVEAVGAAVGQLVGHAGRTEAGGLALVVEHLIGWPPG